MNSDIRLSVGFWQHPKTKKTVRRLGLEGIRSLQVLWLWAAQNKPDGDLSGMDWEYIELAADWQGEERAFFDHCLGVWIDATQDGYVLHDWADHNPWQAEAEARSESARKAAKARWGNADAFWRSSGNRLPTVEEMSHMRQDELPKVFEAYSLSSVYDYAGHIAIGEALDEKGSLPTSFMSLAPASHNDDVWHNVCRMLTLNGEQSRKGLVGHICPLQFDIVDRLINRYTNAGEMVFDPFGGLGTVPYRAILMGRKGRCCELNQDYFRDSVRYLKGADNKVNAPTLFDVLAAEKREVA